MNTIEKRDFIHSHLHFADDILIDEVFKKINTAINSNKVIVGYEAGGKPISAYQFLKDLKEAEDQIRAGNFLTLEEMEREAENW